jgi:hypothetical protein
VDHVLLLHAAYALDRRQGLVQAEALADAGGQAGLGDKGQRGLAMAPPKLPNMGR